MIYAISDLHLSETADKPMDIFGEHWENHFEKIKNSWQKSVTQDDVVVIAGDISWAMNLSDAVSDLNLIAKLPGKKIIVRGNHDYWWSSISQLRSVLPESFYAVQNDSVVIGDIAFCGTRGWSAPGSSEYTEHDIKIYNRELIRMRLSLESAKNVKDIIAVLHYPPYNERGEKSDFVKLFQEYKVSTVIYGHIHGDALKRVKEGSLFGIDFHLTSCDYLDFKLKYIKD